VQTDLEPHGRRDTRFAYASGVTLKSSRVAWGDNRPDYSPTALRKRRENATDLDLTDFSGAAAHPGRDSDVALK